MPCLRPFRTSETSACEMPSSRASWVCETFLVERGTGGREKGERRREKEGREKGERRREKEADHGLSFLPCSFSFLPSPSFPPGATRRATDTTNTASSPPDRSSPARASGGSRRPHRSVRLLRARHCPKP